MAALLFSVNVVALGAFMFDRLVVASVHDAELHANDPSLRFSRYVEQEFLHDCARNPVYGTTPRWGDICRCTLDRTEQQYGKAALRTIHAVLRENRNAVPVQVSEIRDWCQAHTPPAPSP